MRVPGIFLVVAILIFSAVDLAVAAQVSSISGVTVVNHFTTKSIAANGVPGTPATSFTDQDARVCTYSQLAGATQGHLVEWKFINPQSTVQGQTSVTLGRNIRRAWSCLSIAGKSPAYLPGNWAVQFWLDGALIFSDSFTITSNNPPPAGLSVAQHTMAKDVIKSPCCTPVTTTTFLPQDSRAISFVQLAGRPQGEQLKWEFIDPYGDIYTFESTARSKYHWAWLWLANTAFADTSGQWTVKFYINGQLQFQDVFSIASASASSASALQLEHVELRPISFNSAGFTLSVAGRAIESAQLSVFDAQGRVVYVSDFERGSSLRWNGLSAHGRPLANGVYFYVVKVRNLAGAVIRSDVQKLLVLR